MLTRCPSEMSVWYTDVSAVLIVDSTPRSMIVVGFSDELSNQTTHCDHAYEFDV